MVAAFMHYPTLAILDEPTTGLDPLMQQEFYKLILEGKAEDLRNNEKVKAAYLGL